MDRRLLVGQKTEIGNEEGIQDLGLQVEEGSMELH